MRQAAVSHSIEAKYSPRVRATFRGSTPQSAEPLDAAAGASLAFAAGVMHLRVVLGAVVVASAIEAQIAGQSPSLPNRRDSLKFAVIGDSGDGRQPQYDLGRQMAAARALFRFDLVLMVGDNLYGSQELADRVKKFELPYKPLLQSGVVFQAALGNHDDLESRSYRPVNMNGERYYTFAKQNVRFIALDTNMLDAKQPGHRF
jgi:hypothetical protein